MPVVVAFVASNLPTVDEIEQSVIEAKFTKLLKSKIERVSNLRGQTKTWIDGERWDNAFQEIENARQTLFELKNVCDHVVVR